MNFRALVSRAPRPGALLLALPLVLPLVLPGPARADGPLVPADSVAMTGEFVDPVCIFQHDMHGAQSRQCALVRGRVEQGIWFYDIRRHKLYAVIGQNHWDNAQQGFLDALGDTFAIRARLWRRNGSAAIVVNAVYPPDQQPPVRARLWPWRWEWSVLLGCGLLAALYLLALTRWRARLGGSGPFERGRAALFLSGLLVVIVSLNGPIHDLSDEYLFTTHMVQHFLLGQVFPLLLLLGLPRWLVHRLLRPSPAASAFHALASVPLGAILATLVFALWHTPPLYDLMMRVHPVHIVMHLMVMATSVLMWWPVVGGDAVRRPLSQPARMLYIFVLSLPMMAVAAPLSLSSAPLYSWYRWAPRVWGLSPLEDQHLGGLIMWIPGSLYDWGIMSVIFFRWAARERGADVAPALVPALPAHEPLG
ncbi:MAG TPA: cytochrome c oxidase assembly protein [Candidatus Eisenbacteria bacterium]|nr:cytochrome c oxidase assembly protein [Candidatus Eisenbacteria bacterium]